MVKNKSERSLKNININKNGKENIKNIDKEKDKEIDKIKEIIEKGNEINEKVEEIKKEKEKEKYSIKEEIKNNYLNNPNIFRCLNCNLIPQILINEYNQEVEVICDNAYHDKTHHNITNYKDFRLNSLNHSINDNIFCNYCNKSLNH